jgi:hypothetical protein
LSKYWQDSFLLFSEKRRQLVNLPHIFSGVRNPLEKTIKKPVFYYLAYTFSGFILLGTILPIILVADQSFRNNLTTVISPLVDLMVCVPLFLAAKRFTTLSGTSTRSKRMRFFWLAIAISSLLYAMGDVCWAFLDLILKEPPFPSIADFFYLLYYPAFFVGVFLLPSYSGSTGEKINRAIDIAIVMAAATLGFWNFISLRPCSL